MFAKHCEDSEAVKETTCLQGVYIVNSIKKYSDTGIYHKGPVNDQIVPLYVLCTCDFLTGFDICAENSNVANFFTFENVGKFAALCQVMLA